MAQADFTSASSISRTAIFQACAGQAASRYEPPGGAHAQTAIRSRPLGATRRGARSPGYHSDAWRRAILLLKGGRWGWSSIFGRLVFQYLKLTSSRWCPEVTVVNPTWADRPGDPRCRIEEVLRVAGDLDLFDTYGIDTSSRPAPRKSAPAPTQKAGTIADRRATAEACTRCWSSTTPGASGQADPRVRRRCNDRAAARRVRPPVGRRGRRTRPRAVAHAVDPPMPT